MTLATQINNLFILGGLFGFNVLVLLFLEFYGGPILRQVEQPEFECFCEDGYPTRFRNWLVSTFQSRSTTPPANLSKASATNPVIFAPSQSARTVMLLCWMLNVTILSSVVKRSDVSRWVTGLGTVVLGANYIAGGPEEWATLAFVGMILACNVPVLCSFVQQYRLQKRSGASRDPVEHAVLEPTPSPKKVKGGSGKRRSEPHS
jgi:hypothetical protein